MANNAFRKYRTRIAREGVLKAILLSTCIGFAALALTVLFSWFFGFKAGLWLGLGLLVAVSAGLAPVFYCKLYRPTTKAIAKRVDELGLEERVLTMVELENDSSFVAMRQREDTYRALGTVNHMLVKVAVSAALIITFGVGIMIGASAITVGGLYVADVIPSGMELIEDGTKGLPNTYTLVYSVNSNKGGSIIMYNDDWAGKAMSVEEEITVMEGENAPAVLAVEAENYIFVGWTDGVTEAYRQDLAVKGDLKVEAVFLKTVETIEAPTDEKMGAPAIHRDPVEDDGNNNNNGDGPAFPPPPTEGDPMDGEPMGGEWTPGSNTQNADQNQVIDSDTFYGDIFDNAQSEGMDRVNGNDGMSDDMKQSTSDYYSSISQNSSQNGEGEGNGDGNGGD